MNTETIAAIATGLTNSGISIIRVSGDEAVKCVDSIFRAKSKKSLSETRSHSVTYGYIVDEYNNTVDEVLVLLMKAPHSYTREDIVEIDCHGGVLVTKKVLSCVLAAGCRLAEPGEFTKRAFLNGRIDLSQAEAVSDMIMAKNDYVRKTSLSSIKGEAQKSIYSIRDSVLHDVAFIEAALDDPEHIEIDGYTKTLLANININIDEINKIIESSKNGRLLKEGIKTVIVGKPNAGKSSIMNYLLGEDRAIVTDIAGTTRDTLEESIQLDDVTLAIMDTAGIRSTEDVVEKIGVDRARQYFDQADFVLYVVDSSEPFSEEDKEICDRLSEKKGCVLFNKVDLNEKVSPEYIEEVTGKKVINFSTHNKKGKEELTQYINEQFGQGLFNENEPVFLANVRQEQELISAKKSLENVKQSIELSMPEDFYTIDLMDAYEALGRIIGESVEDDLVDKIFKEFCMGK